MRVLGGESETMLHQFQVQCLNPFTSFSAKNVRSTVQNELLEKYDCEVPFEDVQFEEEIRDDANVLSLLYARL